MVWKQLEGGQLTLTCQGEVGSEVDMFSMGVYGVEAGVAGPETRFREIKHFRPGPAFKRPGPEPGAGP